MIGCAWLMAECSAFRRARQDAKSRNEQPGRAKSFGFVSQNGNHETHERYERGRTRACGAVAGSLLAFRFSPIPLEGLIQSKSWFWNRDGHGLNPRSRRREEADALGPAISIGKGGLQHLASFRHFK